MSDLACYARGPLISASCNLVTMFIFGIVSIEVWHTQFPVWAFVLALIVGTSVVVRTAGMYRPSPQHLCTLSLSESSKRSLTNRLASSESCHVRRRSIH